MHDEVIRNRKIPSGSLVIVIPWLLHRHRQLWDKPDHFVPERFLPENAASRQRYSYVPFSVGPRVCAGQAFGLTEAILCLATLAQRARLRLQPGTVVEPVGRLSLRPGDTLPMLVEPHPPLTPPTNPHLRTLMFPYFETLLDHLRRGRFGGPTSVGQHVHWGYWENPGKTNTTSPEEFHQAAESMPQTNGSKSDNSKWNKKYWTSVAAWVAQSTF